MKLVWRMILWLLGIFQAALLGYSNNLVITDVSLENNRTIRMYVSWENAWNLAEAPSNHDAVWIFLKVKEETGWGHLELEANTALFTQPNGDIGIEAVPDGKGIFLRKASMGGGHIPSTAIDIRLKNDLPEGTMELRVFGIEMVFIPEGPFFIGDGASFNSFCQGSTGNPVLISSESVIPGIESQLSILNPNLEGSQYLPSETIPELFPKGYSGFYLMKYEISQEQYADFLNVLSFEAQKERMAQPPDSPAGTRVMAMAGDFRNSIFIEIPGLAGTTGASVACDANNNGVFQDAEDGMNRAANFLSWGDLSAYLDWAALRPISETEFEKACRGSGVNPVQGEFAWGSPFSVDANAITGDGTQWESVSDEIPEGWGLANQGYTGPQGPLRCGFAANPATNRMNSGSTYYGIMEISGNLWEQVVSLSGESLPFTGVLGDGALDNQGNANQPGWPAPVSGMGAGLRGGAWNSGIGPIGSFRDLAVSDRFYAGLAPALRRNTTGGRGGR